jgi:hypothetical protein
MARQREAISLMAASHETGSKRPWPLTPARRSGVSTRSGECTRSAYSRTLPQMMPWVNGWRGVPVTSAIRPSATVTSRLQHEGQSWGHTECMANSRL